MAMAQECVGMLCSLSCIVPLWHWGEQGSFLAWLWYGGGQGTQPWAPSIANRLKEEFQNGAFQHWHQQIRIKTSKMTSTNVCVPGES